MQTLHDYNIDEKQWRSGNGGQYNVATKDGKEYFIKRLDSPRYPVSDSFKGEFKQKKIDLCNEWIRHRQEIIDAIPGSGTGTIAKTIEVFREGSCYYEVSYMINTSKEILENEKHLNVVKEEQVKREISETFEQDMLFDEDYYDLIFVINVAEKTTGWFNKTCNELIRVAQNMPFTLYEAGKEVLPIRAKIIWYGDIYLDGPNAIRETEYFWISDSIQMLEKYMELETAITGSEKPESGMEALCLATERLAESSAKNGMIILCSEFGAYDLDILEKRGSEYTPQVRPLDIGQFVMSWNEDWCDMLGTEYSSDIRQYHPHDCCAWQHCGCRLNHRSLILNTPYQYPWSELEVDLHRCLLAHELDDVIKLLIASIND